jgi:hypothetical protein
MQSLPPLAGEINRILRNLAGGGAGFSLMTVSTSSLPASALRALIEAAARPEDVVGSLVEGSAALLAIRPGKGGEVDTEQGFIDRLQPAMADLCEQRIGGRVTLWLRAVHRTVEEVAHPVDLINALYDAPALPFTVNAGSEADEIALSGRVVLFRPAQPVAEPFIEQPVRIPAALRILNDITLPPRYGSN